RERDERDALVGAAEQHVELDLGVHDGGRVVPAELGGRVPVAEQAGIEEIRAQAPRLERELAEAQRAELQRELEEFLLVSTHVLGPEEGFCIMGANAEQGDLPASMTQKAQRRVPRGKTLVPGNHA